MIRRALFCLVVAATLSSCGTVGRIGAQQTDYGFVRKRADVARYKPSMSTHTSDQYGRTGAGIVSVMELMGSDGGYYQYKVQLLNGREITLNNKSLVPVDVCVKVWLKSEADSAPDWYDLAMNDLEQSDGCTAKPTDKPAEAAPPAASQ